jgi:hypothetical protein
MPWVKKARGLDRAQCSLRVTSGGRGRHEKNSGLPPTADSRGISSFFGSGPTGDIREMKEAAN